MAPVVLVLGVAAMTASGCVWYVPALVDLRAGDDRPRSRRAAAAACLTGWITPAVTAVLLLAGAAWWAVGAAAGCAATVVLWIRAALHRRREAAEEARRWAALRHEAVASDPARPRNVFARWAGAGTVLAVAVAALPLLGGPVRLPGGAAAVAVPAVIAGVFLLLAAAHAHWARTRSRTPHGA